MNEFSPNIRVVSVDQDQIAVSFDSSCEQDVGRATRIVHIDRKFHELSLAVEGFESETNSDIGDRKAYRGRILLKIKRAAGPVADAATEQGPAASNTSELVLAEPTLWLPAIGKERKAGGAYLFPSADFVLALVRQGACDAFSEALDDFFAREAYVDTARRAKVAPGAAVQGGFQDAPVSAPAVRLGASAARRGGRAGDAAERRQVMFRRKIAFAVVGTPVLVIALMWITGVRRSDPIREAVAQQVLQSKESRESQVELTKQTLKEMGLDPGKSNDIGCLAPAK